MHRCLALAAACLFSTVTVCSQDSTFDLGKAGDIKAVVSQLRESAAADTATLDCQAADVPGFQVGETVIDANGYGGTVAGIYRGGRVAVRYPGYRINHMKDASTLARASGCGHGFCVGEAVIDADGYSGTVAGIYRGGRVAARYPGYRINHMKDASTLARASGCGHGFCVGESVIDANGYGGTVAGIYRGGRVAVRYPGYNINYVKDASTLARRP